MSQSTIEINDVNFPRDDIRDVFVGENVNVGLHGDVAVWLRTPGRVKIANVKTGEEVFINLEEISELYERANGPTSMEKLKSLFAEKSATTNVCDVREDGGDYDYAVVMSNANNVKSFNFEVPDGLNISYIFIADESEDDHLDFSSINQLPDRPQDKYVVLAFSER